MSGLLERLRDHQQLVKTFTDRQAEDLQRHIQDVQDVSTSHNQLSQVLVNISPHTTNSVRYWLTYHLTQPTQSGTG